MDCFLTGATARLINPITGDFKDVHSAGLGGGYRITGSAEAVVLNLPEVDRRKLVTWTIDQHRLGNQLPTISSSVIETVSASSLLSVSQRLERVCRWLQSKLTSLGNGVRWRQPLMIGGNYRPDAVVDANWAEAIAWSESATSDDLEPLIDHLSTEGLVKADSFDLTLTVKGWQYLEELSRLSSSSDQGFVAMWFDAGMQSAYQEGIAAAIQAAGYRPMRIDAKEHSNKIDDEIIAEIRRSRFVVADFTCGLIETGAGTAALPRGGVYYEAGFAQGLGIPVIWSCREDHLAHVHFDTRQFNHITWRTADELKEKLTNRISAVIGDGPHRAKPKSVG